MKYFLGVIAALVLVNAANAKVPYEASWQNPVNRNLYRLAVCETGGINNGKPLWTHWNSVYGGALGFRHTTWSYYRYKGFPHESRHATPAQQYAVGRRLVKTFGGYSSWPSCHRRLGLS